MPIQHRVEQGETFASIAHEYGFADWRTIYNHPENRSVRENRRSPFILLPGDNLVIPDKEPPEANRPTDARHRFVKKSSRLRFRLELKGLKGEALSNFPYRLDVEGQHLEGTTNANGILEQLIPANAEIANIRIPSIKGSSQLNKVLQLRIGHLDPVDSTSGAKSRLRNLGYSVGNGNGTWDEKGREALRAFQRSHRLQVTGEYDAATQRQLQDLHHC
jgi:hypothetical protein